jgi:two-component system sensor histidine kinase/response regulator
MPEPSTILIVDDEMSLRLNLRALLEDLGYRVEEAGDGPGALAACARRKPDLVLLDIRMPGMDGFEVCARLRGDPAFDATPIIFLSGLLEAQDKARAFQCGGVDYVTKPFQNLEVEARVRTHLEIRRQRLELKAQHEALRQLESLRDSFTHMVAHDMRGPLTGIIASLELSLGELDPGASGLARRLSMAHSRAVVLNEMIGQMLELSRMESRRMPLEPGVCDLPRLASGVVESLTALAGGRKVSLEAPRPVLAWCDASLVHRILVNLLGNAFKFIPATGAVEIRIQVEGDAARVSVADDGPGIAPEDQGGIFEKFRQSPGGARSNGVGLGLAFCKSAVEAHGGAIGVQSRPGEGCTFWFTLPLHRPGT